MNLAIIPARSGSKGLPDKNIKMLNGKPLMAYSIEAAIESQVFDEIIVSTDSQEYAEIALKYGARVPFLRSLDLSRDSSVIWDVVKDIVKYYQDQNLNFETVMLLQPTSPLRTSEDIIAAYDLMKANHAEVIISVCEADHSPLWMNTLGDDQSLNQFISAETARLPRQKLSTYYRINGAIYLLKIEVLKEPLMLYGQHSFALKMSKSHSVDVDDMVDFLMAKAFLDLHE